MRNLFSCMVTIGIIATIALLPVEGYSEPIWRLYDDFEYKDGDPDPSLWNVLVDGPSQSTISIEDGEAKIVQPPRPPESPPDLPGAYNFLFIKKQPKKIKGIRVTVRVEKLNQEDVGDLLGGIAAFIGNIGDYLVLDHFYINSHDETIICGLSVGPDPSSLPFSLFHGKFYQPINIIGIPFTITTIFSEQVITYEVEGLGTITRELPEELDPTENKGKALATMSNTGDGTAVVYFDDVYILQ